MCLTRVDSECNENVSATQKEVQEASGFAFLFHIERKIIAGEIKCSGKMEGKGVDIGRGRAFPNIPEDAQELELCLKSALQMG